MLHAQPTSAPTFVCNLDASRARNVCDAHTYLVEKRADLMSSVRCCGYWPEGQRTLDKIDRALVRIESVILGDADPDSVFGRVPPELWAIYTSR